MAIRTTARVEIFESVIASESSPGGDSYKHLAKTNRLVFSLAVASAPVGETGELKASHVNAGVRKTGRYGATARVNNTSEHAGWVHDGTTGPIVPKQGAYLRIPPGSGFPLIFTTSVRGQRANPWLWKAGQHAAAIMGGRADRIRL